MMYTEIDLDCVKDMVEEALNSGINCSMTIDRQGEDITMIIHEEITPNQICNQMSNN